MDLTKKVGPLPMWGWGAAGLGVALAYSFLRRAKSSSDTSDSDTATATATGAVPADQVPDFISNSYVTVNNPAGSGPTATAPPSTTTTPPVAPPKTPTPPTTSTPKPAPAKAVSYKVKTGDTLTSIAKKYGTTVDAIWTYNTTGGHRPADTVATLKKRGKNLLYAGETILIPPK